MPTDRPRLQAYLEPELHQRFAEWKALRGIAKDSEALNGLLAEYFGVSSSPPTPSQVPQEAIEKIVRDEVNVLFKNRMEEDADFWVNRLSERLDTVEQSLERFISCSHRQIDELKGDLGERLAACEDSLEILLSESPSDLPGAENDTRSPEQLSSEEAPGLEGEDSQKADLEGDTAEAIEKDSLISSDLPGNSPGVNLTQLARRLGVSKSVISNRKNRADFEEWSKGKDPEGVAWRYHPGSQKFYPVEGNS